MSFLQLSRSTSHWCSRYVSKWDRVMSLMTSQNDFSTRAISVRHPKCLNIDKSANRVYCLHDSLIQSSFVPVIEPVDFLCTLPVVPGALAAICRNTDATWWEVQRGSWGASPDPLSLIEHHSPIQRYECQRVYNIAASANIVSVGTTVVAQLGPFFLTAVEGLQQIIDKYITDAVTALPS